MPHLRDRQGLLRGAVGSAPGLLPGSCCKKPLLEFKLWQAPGHSMQSVSAGALPHSLRRPYSSRPQLYERLHSCSRLPYRKLATAVVCIRLTVLQLGLQGGGSSILCRQLPGKAWSSSMLLAGSRPGCRSQHRSKMAGTLTLRIQVTQCAIFCSPCILCILCTMICRWHKLVFAVTDFTNLPALLHHAVRCE